MKYGYDSSVTALFALTIQPSGGSRADGSSAKGIIPVHSPVPSAPETGRAPWSSGEEIDYVLRAIRSGACVVYDPAVTVTHARKRYTASELRAVGRRDGASVGWLLRRHGYGARTTARMLVRPVGGIGASLVRGDLTRASFHAATLGGRLRGYVGAPSR